MEMESNQPDWWQRNWKWLVPTLVLVCIVVIGLFIAGIFFFVKTLMESSEPYKVGMQKALSNPAVVARLGKPVTPGWLPSGNIQISDQSGEAELAISLQGSLASGTLYIQAKKRGGRWRYEMLEVEIDDGAERVPLLGGPG